MCENIILSDFLFLQHALGHYALVFDAVYTPKITRLLREAEESGATIVSGLEMFIGQAYEQYERFTGLPGNMNAPHLYKFFVLLLCSFNKFHIFTYFLFSFGNFSAEGTISENHGKVLVWSVWSIHYMLLILFSSVIQHEASLFIFFF